MHPDDRDRYRQALVQHFKGESERFDCEVRYRDRRGEWRWAFDLSAGDDLLARRLVHLAPHIAYVGKRGSFVQFLGLERVQDLDDEEAEKLRAAGVAIREDTVARIERAGDDGVRIVFADGSTDERGALFLLPRFTTSPLATVRALRSSRAETAATRSTPPAVAALNCHVTRP